MERKTMIHAEEGKQELTITREFDLPVELLFKAYVEAEIVEQWMGTKVIKLESKNHGSFQFETSNNKGNIVLRANGVIHECVPNKRITRTFEMENTPLPIQLEYIDFEEVAVDTSKLTIHIIYKSVAHRDQVLQMPFEYGINMAHDRLQEIVQQINNLK